MTARIVSLAPSATHLVRTVGAGDHLVGVTEHTAEGPSVGGWLTPDLDAVVEAEPDVVLTTDDLQTPFVEELRDRGVDVVHFTPTTLPGVVEYIREVGATVGRGRVADRLARDVESRIDRVRERVAGADRPVVYCEEWDEPPMVGGNWVPEVVEAAGGTYPFCAPGERSRRIDAEEIERHTPSYAIVHLCGRGTDVDSAAIERRGWGIPNVHVLPDDLLNRPGPQLATAAERIARVLHPDRMPEST